MHEGASLVDVGDIIKAVAKACAEKCSICNSVDGWPRHVAMAEAAIAAMDSVNREPTR